MLIPSIPYVYSTRGASLSRRVNANSQQRNGLKAGDIKLIKKGEC